MLKTTWELKREKGIHKKNDRNYDYPNFIRERKKFTSFQVPQNLQKSLPFKTKEKNIIFDSQKEIEKIENQVAKKIITDQEKSEIYFIQRLQEIQKEREKQRKIKVMKKRIWKEKWLRGMNKNMIEKAKKRKKMKYARGNSKSK